MYCRFTRPTGRTAKEHFVYWSIVESTRCARRSGGTASTGLISDSQRQPARGLVPGIDAVRRRGQKTRQLGCFLPSRCAGARPGLWASVLLDAMELHSSPRQWGAFWLSRVVSRHKLDELDRFWAGRLTDSREGPAGQHILQTFRAYPAIIPAASWRLHRPVRSERGWGIFSARTNSLVSRTRCTAAWTGAPHKTALFSHCGSNAGRICSAHFEFAVDF